MDLNKLIDMVFSAGIKPPSSIQIDLGGNDMDVKDVFEFLLTFFTEGMKLLYGDSRGKVDLSQLSESDIRLLAKYIQSIGFGCQITVYPPEEANKYDFMAIKYTNVQMTSNTKLEELKLPIRSKDTVYVISFTHLSF